MDFTFINWSEHLFAGFDTVEMPDSVSEVFYRAYLCHESCIEKPLGLQKT